MTAHFSTVDLVTLAVFGVATFALVCQRFVALCDGRPTSSAVIARLVAFDLSLYVAWFALAWWLGRS